MDSELISISEAAKRLGISRQRTQVLVQTGRLPAVRVGYAWVINSVDLKRVMDRPQGWKKGRSRKKMPKKSAR